MKPILFNTEMVRAILDGRKTQTRRVVKAPVLYRVDTPPDVIAKAQFPKGYWDFIWHGKAVGSFTIRPPYQPGDILYVRETWAENTIPHSGNYAGIEYRADYYGGREPILRWRPSIHMPRNAARIFLRVTDVRVERLWDMQPIDICAEGVCVGANDSADAAYKSFSELWDTTIKPADRDRYGWDANPWVWVISFERYNPADPEGGTDGCC